jgi:CheY-like chemotaxis protein
MQVQSTVLQTSAPPVINILLVEDDALLALAEKRELERFGYSVRSVANGEEAAKMALGICPSST